MTTNEVTINGNEYDFGAVVNLMDDEIREKLHMELAPCSDQDFIDAYLTAHLDKYGQDFVIS